MDATLTSIYNFQVRHSRIIYIHIYINTYIYIYISDCEVYATPWGQQKAVTCACLLSSQSVSSNMSCSKFWEPKLYPDRQTYSQNKARQFFSQVLMAPSFVLLMSVLHR